METSHWETLGECVVCGQVPDKFPLYHCPYKHHYCQPCFEELQKSEGQSTCKMCKFKGLFTQTNSGLLSKIKHRPGIGRPYRYNVNMMPGTRYNYSKNYGDENLPAASSTELDEESRFRSSIGMSKEEFYKRQVAYESSDRKKNPKPSCFYSPVHSRGPLKCPHRYCNKTVAVAQFVNHFRSDHSDVQVFSLERSKEICCSCDVSVIEHGLHVCLAMITVYDTNRIDFVRSKSSESVIKTCSRFCQRIPVDTFWLMVTGSRERKSSAAYCFFWVFTNSEAAYKCSIELGSENDSACLSTYCNVTNSSTDEDFVSSAAALRCLLVTKSSLRTILREGVGLNLRVTVH